LHLDSEKCRALLTCLTYIRYQKRHLTYLIHPRTKKYYGRIRCVCSESMCRLERLAVWYLEKASRLETRRSSCSLHRKLEWLSRVHLRPTWLQLPVSVIWKSLANQQDKSSSNVAGRYWKFRGSSRTPIGSLRQPSRTDTGQPVHKARGAKSSIAAVHP
jgi:hypothetical protein